VSLVEESCVEMKKDSLVLRWKMRLEGLLSSLSLPQSVHSLIQQILIGCFCVLLKALF